MAAPLIDGLRHPGEVHGPNGPVAYISLAVPVEQRRATVSVLSATSGLRTVSESGSQDSESPASSKTSSISSGICPARSLAARTGRSRIAAPSFSQSESSSRLLKNYWGRSTSSCGQRQA